MNTGNNLQKLTSVKEGNTDSRAFKTGNSRFSVGGGGALEGPVPFSLFNTFSEGEELLPMDAATERKVGAVT